MKAQNSPSKRVNSRTQLFKRRSNSNRRPKALLLIVVHLYGQSAVLDPLLGLCERYGVALIEDAAESLGATHRGKSTGTFGKTGIYSFSGNKIITTSGGGMLVTEDESVATHARKLATQAREPAPHFEHKEIGFNYRMSNVLAGIGRGQLRMLDAKVDARRKVFTVIIPPFLNHRAWRLCRRPNGVNQIDG